MDHHARCGGPSQIMMVTFHNLSESVMEPSQRFVMGISNREYEKYPQNIVWLQMLPDRQRPELWSHAK